MSGSFEPLLFPEMVPTGHRYDLEKVYLELLLAQAQAQAQNPSQNQSQGLTEQNRQVPLQTQQPQHNQFHQSQSFIPQAHTQSQFQSQSQVPCQTQTQTQGFSSILSNPLPQFGGHGFESQAQNQVNASQTRSLNFSHLFSPPQSEPEPQPLSLAQLFSQSQTQSQQAQQQQQYQQQQYQQQQPLTSLSDLFTQSQTQSQLSPRVENHQCQVQSQELQLINPPPANTILNWSITQQQLSLQSQNPFQSSQGQMDSSFLQQLPSLNPGIGLSLNPRQEEGVSEPSSFDQLCRSTQDASQVPFSNDWLSSIKFGAETRGSCVQSSHEDVSEQISQHTASTVATASIGEGTSGEGRNTEARKSSSSRYESQKRRDWNTFGQYLKNHRPPITMSKCTSQYVVEFLRYLDQFGKTKVHNKACQFYGSSGGNPCGCPMKQAWGSLDSLVGRLRAAYEENGGKSENNPFGTRIVRTFLRDVREHQAKARGIAYEKKKRKRTGTAPVPLGSTVASSSGGFTSASTSGGLGKIIQGNFKEM